MSAPNLFAAYAPPSAPLSQTLPNLKSAGEVTIKGSRLIVPDGYMFPPVCIISGATTGLERPETHRAAYNPRMTTGILIGGVVGALVAKTGKVEEGCYSACVSAAAKARGRRHRIIGGVIGGLILGFLLLNLSNGEMAPYLPLILLLLAVSFAVALGGTQRKLQVVKIKDGKLHITGVSRKVRTFVVEFEYRRLQTYRKAAEEHARAQAAAAAAAAAMAPAPPAGPPPLPMVAGYPAR